MSDEVQPGTKIDADVWEQFREEVRERHGVVRGHLKTELENALRQYSGDAGTTDADIERRLARIEAQVGVGVADGGADTSEPAEDTHTPNGVPEEKPHRNTGKKPKVLWLAEQVIRAEVPNSRNLKMIPRPKIRAVIDEEYGFDDERAANYVEKVIDELDLRQHPTNDVVYVSQDKYDKVVEEERQKRRDEAAKETDTQ